MNPGARSRSKVRVSRFTSAVTHCSSSCIGGVGALRLAWPYSGTAQIGTNSNAAEDDFIISYLPFRPTLYNVGNEPLSLLHVDTVRLPNRSEQRALLHRDTVAVSCDRRNCKEPQAEPAAKREPGPDVHHHASGIGWVPHQPIRSRP